MRHDIKQLLEIVNTHRQGLVIFLAGWAVLWTLTIATWLFDADGNTVGMLPVFFYLHLLLPLVPGFLVGLWGKSASGTLKAAVFAGLIVAVLDFLLLLLWGLVLLALGKTGSADPQHSSWGGALEALIFGAGNAVIGAVLGLLGGWLGGRLRS